jgi:nitroreductase
MDDMDSLGAVDHVLQTTRAVRRNFDLDRPVPRSVILDCIRIAQQAPNGANLQNWRFVVVTDPDLRLALAEIYRANSDVILGRARSIPAEDQQSTRVYASASHLLETLHRVPVHVIPCIPVNAAVVHDAPSAGSYGSVIPAAWSFMLALRARGLGSAWTTLHLRREAQAATLLGIPTDVMQVALIPVGYLKPGVVLKPALRPDPSTVTGWNGWSAT